MILGSPFQPKPFLDSVNLSSNHTKLKTKDRVNNPLSEEAGARRKI